MLLAQRGLLGSNKCYDNWKSTYEKIINNYYQLVLSIRSAEIDHINIFWRRYPLTEMWDATDARLPKRFSLKESFSGKTIFTITRNLHTINYFQLDFTIRNAETDNIQKIHSFRIKTNRNVSSHWCSTPQTLLAKRKLLGSNYCYNN